MPALAQTKPWRVSVTHDGADLTDDALGLAKDELDDAGLLLPLLGVLASEVGHLDIGEVDGAALGLGDDLGGVDDDVAGPRGVRR